MGKYVYALLTVFVMELTLWIFGGTTYSQSSMFNLLINPATLLSSELYSKISFAVGAFGAVAIITGFIFQGNVYGVFAGVAGATLTFGRAIVNFYGFIKGQMTTSLLIGDPVSTFITAILLSPFLLYFIIATLEWIRGNQ